MNEYATITIERFRDPDDNPTCSTINGSCEFALTRNFGTYNSCFFENVPLYRNNGGVGFLQPHKKCPIWSKDDNS